MYSVRMISKLYARLCHLGWREKSCFYSAHALIYKSLGNDKTSLILKLILYQELIIEMDYIYGITNGLLHRISNNFKEEILPNIFNQCLSNFMTIAENLETDNYKLSEY